MKKNYNYKKAHHFLGVCFPDGNRKQDRMISLALSPEHTCPADAPCRKENGGNCYYQKEMEYYTSVSVSAYNNWKVFKTAPERFWKAVEKAIKTAIAEGVGFRWFEGGDCPSYKFFCRQMELCKKYPGVCHGMTKQYEIVNRYIREHGGDKDCILKYYHLRFSKWEDYPMPNEYSMPVFRLVFTEEETTCPEQRLKMAGKEWSCADCYFRGVGCYRADHGSINCIDHKAEQKIVRRRKKNEL